MMEWLGLGSTVFLQRATENANGNDGKAFTLSGAVFKIIQWGQSFDLLNSQICSFMENSSIFLIL